MNAKRLRLLGLLMPALLLCSCQREERSYRPDDPFASKTLYDEKYEKNAYNLSQGKQLFMSFNCSGCHGLGGGGGMGPPLMDDLWIYGHEPGDIFTTISEGRPDGMPSFKDKIPPYQIWQLVAFVRSLSGWPPSDASPGRGDHMHTGTPPQSREERTPRPDPEKGGKP